LTVTVAGTLI